MADKLQELMQKIEEMAATIATLNSRVKEAEDKLPDMQSTIEQIAKRNYEAENAPRVVVLRKHNGYRVDKNGDRHEVPLTPGQYREGCCPWCNKEKKESLLDLTPQGRWSCRQCGKTWAEEALGQPYSKKLERFLPTGDNDEEFLAKITVNGKVAPLAEDTSRLDKLEKDNAELKALILQLTKGQKVA